MGNTLKTRIRSIRNYLELSRRSFAEKLDISETTIRRWENGSAKRIYPSTLEKLILSLHKLDIICSKEWINNGTGDYPKKLFNQERKSYEIITLPGSYHNPTGYSDCDMIARHAPDLHGYINIYEEYIWANENWETPPPDQGDPPLNLPKDKLVGYTLKEIADGLDDGMYKICKPYINKALKGHEVTFELGWEYAPNKIKYLRNTYVPDIRNDIVVGVFVYCNYIMEPQEGDYNSKFSSKKDICEILPKLPLTAGKYIANDYILALKKTEELFSQYDIETEMCYILKIAYHLYSYSQTYGFFDEEYANSIIIIAIKAGYLLPKG